MRGAAVTGALLLPVAVIAAEKPATAPSYTYTQVYELVTKAEGGDSAAKTAGLGSLREAPDVPLAGAAWGRLMVVGGCGKAFVAIRYWDYWRGFVALNAYIAAHPSDPIPRVWRAASAVDTNYVFWKPAAARADVAFALQSMTEDPDLPGEPARCKLLMGIIAKDNGDLEAAMAWWQEAFAADPAGPAGREAARYLDLFTG